jgi:hypothetical protein
VTPLPHARSAVLLELALGVAAFALYATGMCRDLYWYDSAELTAAAVTLGVPHPPGYPLYTLLAHLFTLLPLSAPVAVNALSATSAALAVVLACACARRLGAGAGGAVVAGLVLAGTPALWGSALVAEVYAPALCFVLGSLYLLLGAVQCGSAARAWLAAALAGLGLGVHLSLATLGLGYAALCAAAPPGQARAATRLRWLAGAALCTGLGYALAYAYVPLRAGAGGVPDHAAPGSFERLAWLLTGGNYRHWFAEPGSAAQVAARLARVLVEQLTGPGLALAALGLVALARRQRATAVALVLGVAGNLAVFARYRVDDLEVFLLPGIAWLALLAGVGAHMLGELGSRARRGPAVGAAALTACVVLAVARLVHGAPQHDLHAFTAATDYAERLERELPAHAVILDYTTPAEWKYATVFAMYHQGVLGHRRDVVVARNLGPAPIARLLSEGRAVYMFAPVAPLEPLLRLEPAGALWRVVALRSAPPTPP